MARLFGQAEQSRLGRLSRVFSDPRLVATPFRTKPPRFAAALVCNQRCVTLHATVCNGFKGHCRCHLPSPPCLRYIVTWLSQPWRCNLGFSGDNQTHTVPVGNGWRFHLIGGEHQCGERDTATDKKHGRQNVGDQKGTSESSISSASTTGAAFAGLALLTTFGPIRIQATILPLKVVRSGRRMTCSPPQPSVSEPS